MSSRILDALGTTEPLATIFADASIVAAMLDVEVALARAQASLGLVPADVAAAIAAAASARDFDIESLARDSRQSGTVAVPFVAALTSRVRALAPGAARYVHWGATSQDVVDTALVLVVKRACDAMATDHVALAGALGALSDRHANDVMLGRTLLQPAPPITFGLKVAEWFHAAHRSWSRVDTAAREACVLQFGGAAGTLASLGAQGPAAADALARDLGLPNPPAPWHTSRDRLAAFVAACGVHVGALGKMARDISLLMQFEVREAREAGGGSSTMPNKENPSGCAIVLAAATRLPGLVSTMLAALVQEHERGVGAWHAEWPTVSAAVQATGAAMLAMRQVIDGLSVDPARMRANIDATNGAVFTEKLMMRAGPALGRDVAHARLRELLARSRSTGTPLAALVPAFPDLAAALTAADLATLDDPADYLGAAETFRQQLLATR